MTDWVWWRERAIDPPAPDCVRHKERNVLDHLPERDRPTVRQRLRSGWRLDDHTAALERLRTLAGHPVGGPALTVVGLTVGFVAIALLGFEVVDAASGLVAFWPPNGLVVALFVLLPSRLRPWVLLGVLPGELIADSIHGYPLLAAFGFSVTDLLESAIAGVVLLRIAGRPPRGDRQRDFYALLIAAGVAPLVSGIAGAEISHAQWGSPYLISLLLWWLGDMIGILLVVSLAMSCFNPPLHSKVLGRFGAVAEVAIVVAVSLAVFGLTTLPIGFAVLAPLTLLAIRQGLRYTAVWHIRLRGYRDADDRARPWTVLRFPGRDVTRDHPAGVYRDDVVHSVSDLGNDVRTTRRRSQARRPRDP